MRAYPLRHILQGSLASGDATAASFSGAEIAAEYLTSIRGITAASALASSQGEGPASSGVGAVSEPREDSGGGVRDNGQQQRMLLDSRNQVGFDDSE